jgi:carbon storage regulator
MLVLTRKNGEQVVIGRDIVVTVLSIQGGRVKLGFSGPAEIPIHRQEVREQIDADESEKLECIMMN